MAAWWVVWSLLAVEVGAGGSWLWCRWQSVGVLLQPLRAIYPELVHLL